MAAVSTEKWIKFFAKAGIPPRAAATYALTFADNRIQMDMLLDLNKEYLRDMGITLMGDVIAILRHARQVHEELTHEKLLYSSKGVCASISLNSAAVAKESINDSAPSKPVQRNSKVVRAPSQSSSSSSFNSSSSSQSSPAPSPPKKVSVSSRISDPNQRQAPTSRTTGCIPLLHSVKTSSEKANLKKIDSQPESRKRTSDEISRPKPAAVKPVIEEHAVPVKKVRRVLPEHEGGYKIKMPSGSTPRSQQLLAKQKELSKKTVFDRLGRSSSPSGDPLTAAVSSTTPDPTFTVTGLEIAKKTKNSSVFSRLGDKQVSSTSVAPVVKGTLPYAGILKTPNTESSERSPVVVQKTPSMVADSLANANRSDVQSRIGMSRQVSGIKRSATVISTPKQEYEMKRSATIVVAPKPDYVTKRSATIVSIPKQVKEVKTGGFLARHSGDVNRTVKSRLGQEEVNRMLQVSNLRPVPTVSGASIPAKERLRLSSVNGSLSNSINKKVTFSSGPSRVSLHSDVFSRLGR